VREVRFDFAYMFKYSEREGTYAHKRIEDDIPEETKGRRLREVIALQEDICAQIMKPHVGKVYNVLVEGDSKKSARDWVGRTDTFKSVIFAKDDTTVLGDIVPVRVTQTTSHTLLGEIEWSC